MHEVHYPAKSPKLQPVSIPWKIHASQFARVHGCFHVNSERAMTENHQTPCVSVCVRFSCAVSDEKWLFLWIDRLLESYHHQAVVAHITVRSSFYASALLLCFLLSVMSAYLKRHQHRSAHAKATLLASGKYFWFWHWISFSYKLFLLFFPQKWN